jgi:alkylation response protein AidB-like acyl-CoA dehydrogenase
MPGSGVVVPARERQHRRQRDFRNEGARAVSKHVVEMSTQEQERAVDVARELAPEFDKVGKEGDQANEFPFSLVPLYKESGLVGIGVPKKYGGGGADIWTLSRISYELAKGDPACALAFNMHQVMVGILRGLMSEKQQDRWMSLIAAENKLMCGAFSEERAGLTGLADTVAKPTSGGAYEISGRKVWATLSEAADIATFNATVTDEDGALPQDHQQRIARDSVFIVDKDTPGVSIIRTWDTHGMRATGTQTLAFDSARVAGDALVGDMRGGLFQQFEWAAMLFGGVYLGLTEKAYDATREILLEKSLGATMAGADLPLREVGFVQHGLGEMKVKLETSKRVLEMTCRMLIEGRDAGWHPMARPALIDVVKAVTTQNAVFVANSGMRLVGGSTFRRGHVLERLYRDSRSGPFQPMTTDQTYDHLGKFELGLMDVPAEAPAEPALV